MSDFNVPGSRPQQSTTNFRKSTVDPRYRALRGPGLRLRTHGPLGQEPLTLLVLLLLVVVLVVVVLLVLLLLLISSAITIIIIIIHSNYY